MKNKRKEVGMPTGRWGDPSWSNGNVLLTAMTKINRPGVAYGGPGHGVDGVYLEPGCAIAVNAMLDAYAQQHGGAILPLNEGYRSYGGQVQYWEEKGHNPALAAPPGTSNHGWGEAVDIGVALGSSQRAWLLANGPAYGFAALSDTDPVHFDYSGTYKPTTPTNPTQEEDMGQLVKHPNGSVAFAATDGTFTVLTSMDEVNALVATGAAPATLNALPDGFIWNLRLQVAQKRKTQNEI